jgi:hypothetical protein
VQAFVRYEQAALEKDSEDAFHALFECLAWAVSLDERLGFPDQPELRGLRFVRNRVHHQWADALWLDERGESFPLRIPPVYYEWRWREVEDLPSGRPSPDDEAAYRQHLAGNAARFTLGMIGGYFRTVGGQAI